jgi:hypothetical protein
MNNGYCEVCGGEMGRQESAMGPNGYRYFCKRGFDCPPGNESRMHESWALAKEYRPLVRSLKSGLFTIEELMFIMQHTHAGNEDGQKMKDLYEKYKDSTLPSVKIERE